MCLQRSLGGQTISLSPSKRKKEEGGKGFVRPIQLLLISAVPPFGVGSIGPEKNERWRKFYRDKTVVMEREGEQVRCIDNVGIFHGQNAPLIAESIHSGTNLILARSRSPPRDCVSRHSGIG